jgi:3-oxoacyl-(acyl-carrier-protein) synthase
MDVYIQSAEQISVQQPLSDAWFACPTEHDKVYVRAQEPDYKQLLNPNKSRRMGKILRRAVVSAQKAVQQSGITMPDAVISGTGLGCIENTEIFLTAMLNEGEEFLQPTYFMQSTHNTISSQIAIELQCHGYNTTYSHKGISFDSALLDAFLQFRAGKIHSALVGGYDEMTPNFQLMLSRLGDWRKDGENVKLRRGEEAFAGETSVSMMLTDHLTQETKPLCRVSAVEMLYKPTMEQLQNTLDKVLQENECALSDIDAVMTGMNGNPSTDDNYRKVINGLFAGRPLGGYKQVFGESYTASGLGVYACAVCLQKGEIPAHLLLQQPAALKNIQRILLYHQYDMKNHSLILLASC